MKQFNRNLSIGLLGTMVVLAACGKNEEASVAVVAIPAVTVAVTAAVAQTCGKVSVADMNWQSAEVLAHIDAIILTSGFGCDVELVLGDTLLQKSINSTLDVIQTMPSFVELIPVLLLLGIGRVAGMIVVVRYMPFRQ
jgi:ABC-type proline/glycine betaine transport system permease subunit